MDARGTSLAYQWNKSGVAIAGATTAILTLTDAQANDAGSYTVVVSNEFGSAISTSATLIIEEPPSPPVITTQPSAAYAFEGDSAYFRVGAIGDILSYQWRKEGVAIAGATTSTLTLSPVTAADYVTYDVIVTNPGGALTSAAVTLAVPPAPVINMPPQSTTAKIGNYVTLTIDVTGYGMSYQWRKDGVPLPGRTTPDLVLGPISTLDYGSYDVLVTNKSGTAVSAPATLSRPSGTRLSNLSVRTNLSAGQTIIIGFVANGGNKDVLIRAGGPYLDSLKLGLAGLPDPRVSVYSGDSIVRQNDDWDKSLAPIFAQVGAGAFIPGSKDAALLLSISGTTDFTRTAHISGTGSGAVLVEAYDTTDSTSTRLVNVSARSRVGTGDNILIAGFVIDGGTKRVLIRGLGPALAQFNVPDVLTDPKLTIFRGDKMVGVNDNWEPLLAVTFAQLGASQLELGSKDAAIVIDLPAGVYTAHLVGADGGTGEGLIEVYDAD